MITANINITSNIYLRSDPDIRKDALYTQQITGAERLRTISEQYIGLEAVPLTPVQKSILDGTTPCHYIRNGEVPYGAVRENGRICWVNRCENRECRRYAICSAGKDFRPIIRTEHEPDDTAAEQESLLHFYETLGIRIQEDPVVFEKDKQRETEAEAPPKPYQPPTEPSPAFQTAKNGTYTEIDSPDCIIRAPLDSHIILNSGPGTGKTYTIIQRLIWLLENELCPPEEIYILCYTRSAKKVVEQKIGEAIVQGQLRPAAQNICILTFDSYATYFLMAMREHGVLQQDFAGCDYNERIRLFNEHIRAEDFADVRYFIVDEIQDLVNDRAKMVLQILKHLQCGYLLAGDRCQSIYDYEADDDATLDSVRFYELAEQQFPADMQRYEIIGNRRQTPELAKASAEMRHVLLHEKIADQNRSAHETMQRFSENMKVEEYVRTLTEPSVSTAILCRSNGEAEYVSTLLCEKQVPHILNRGVNNAAPLPRWIAAVFWDHCKDTMSRNDFLERCRFRCSELEEPEALWEQLCKMAKSRDTAVISMPQLITALGVANDIPGNFYEIPPQLTVSTIHKAKGSEFDRVILVDSEMPPSAESAEEARVRYVALTRPKQQFLTMRKRKMYFKRSLSGRVIETGRHNPYKSSNIFCKSITVGLADDIDNTSFVSGDFETAVSLQEYILAHVRRYDKLTAVRSAVTGNYEVYHKERCIGVLSKKMFSEIENGISATNFRNKLPNRLENLFVSGITTEILRRSGDAIPLEYQKSKICFGVQITGLAKLKFEKRG